MCLDHFMLAQLLVHFWADFVFQSDWMALNKTKRSIPCLIHVLIYTACFLVLTTSWKALLVIGATHFLIDRFSLPKYLIWAKNHMNPHMEYPTFEFCKTTGYFDDAPDNRKLEWSIEGWTQRPMFITVWLYIVTDNLCHLTINALALYYLCN